MREDLNQSDLKSQLSYDQNTGEFRRLLARSNSVMTGDIAGWIDGDGYRKISINHQEYRAHRLAFLYMTGRFPNEHVDHINGVTDDNRWANLRAVTRSENLRNQKLSKKNTSGAIGVHWFKRYQKWQAYIHVDGRNKSLGYHEKKEDAINARKVAEERYGYHPNLGRQPRCAEPLTTADKHLK